MPLTNHVWIVEMWNAERKRYEPTVGAALNREDGRLEIRRWRAKNPYDRFRVRRYESCR